MVPDDLMDDSVGVSMLFPYCIFDQCQGEISRMTVVYPAHMYRQPEQKVSSRGRRSS